MKTLRKAVRTESDDLLVSIVIASVNGLPEVADGVESFAAQQAQAAFEIIVVDATDETTRQILRSRFPNITVVAESGRPSIPRLRAIGIKRARGRYVAITEDHCLARPGWLAALAKAAESAPPVVAGTVENVCDRRWVDRAAFLCEYARFLPPASPHDGRDIPGNNVAYSRELLDQYSTEIEADLWESFLHAKMRQAGVAFHHCPAMIVGHNKSSGLGRYLSQRFHFSRSFAAMRLQQAPRWMRIAYAGATVLLPPLLLGRLAAVVAAKRSHARQFCVALPLLCVFVVAWSFGEAAGALLGPGDSAQKVQ